MIHKQKVTNIGNSVGFTLPKSLRDKLNIKPGDYLYINEDLENKKLEVLLSENDVQKTPEIDEEFYKLLKETIQEYSAALKSLAKK